MKLHCKEYGSGRPMVILHGLFGSGDNWATQARALAGLGYHVFVVDMRNHGRSPHSDVFRYEAMAADLHEFLHDHQLINPVLIGHSMGGKTVMFFAQLFPEISSRIVVVDMATRQYPPPHAAVVDALMAIDLSKATTRKEVELQLISTLHDEPTVQLLLKSLYWNEREKLAWRFNVPVIAAHIHEVGKVNPVDRVVNCPILFIRGASSDYIRDEDFADIQKRFPLAELKTVERAGHRVHAENPQGFLDALLPFLTERDR